MATTPIASIATLAAPAIETFTALLRTAAFAPIHDRGFLRITGEDRVRWLNGMVTNSIQDLAPGAGCYNFLLNAQGHIQGIADIFALEDSLLLETDAAQLTTILTLLDRFIIMDDVELTAQEAAATDAGLHGLLLAGPAAPSLLDDLALTLPSLPAPSLTTHTWQGAFLRLIHTESTVVPRFELWAESATIAAIAEALSARELLQAGPEPLEWLRTLEGTPRFGTDIRGRELPQETAAYGTQSRALHFSKGCYLGQEIVERVRSRGRVHRTFSGFTLQIAPETTLPAPGTALLMDEQPVGELTTVTAIPSCLAFPGGSTIALGYIRREALEQHRAITVVGGTARPSPLPIPLDRL